MISDLFHSSCPKLYPFCCKWHFPYPFMLWWGSTWLAILDSPTKPACVSYHFDTINSWQKPHFSRILLCWWVSQKNLESQEILQGYRKEAMMNVWHHKISLIHQQSLARRTLSKVTQKLQFRENELLLKRFWLTT